MTKKVITSEQLLIKIPQNKIVDTKELLSKFPGMQMPSLTTQLIRLTNKGMLEKLGASVYRVATNKPYYQVSKYVVLPQDLFEITKKYLEEGHTLRGTQFIVGIPFDSVKFVFRVITGKLNPVLMQKSALEMEREKLGLAGIEQVQEVEKAEELALLQENVAEPDTSPEIAEPLQSRYFPITVQGVTIKVEEGLQMMFENGTVCISR